jgi:hypothetical protein
MSPRYAFDIDSRDIRVRDLVGAREGKLHFLELEHVPAVVIVSTFVTEQVLTAWQRRKSNGIRRDATSDGIGRDASATKKGKMKSES